MMKSPFEFQQEIAARPLNRQTASPDAIKQFRRWYEEAMEAQIFQANAMTLATVSAEGQPAARMVLMDAFDQTGFVFYTSYESRKGQELATNPRAALVFWWGPLFRQVRIEGTVAGLSADRCDAYFATRPREHQLETWAFPQSQVIASREQLARRLEAVKARYGDGPIPRPPHFGGYRLDPSVIEFWHGRQDWLHDALKYTRQEDGGWRIERLAP